MRGEEVARLVDTPEADTFLSRQPLKLCHPKHLYRSPLKILMIHRVVDDCIAVRVRDEDLDRQPVFPVRG